MRLLFDCETNGLLDRPDLKALCAVAVDLDTGEIHKARPSDLPAFVELVSRADVLAGHNIVDFDIPLMRRLYGFELRHDVKLLDTRLISRMRYVATLLGLTAKYRSRGTRSEKQREERFPKALMNGRKLHSLEAWGWRIGHHKGEYLKQQGVQEEFSEDLLTYCVKDVLVNRGLLHVLLEPDRRGERMWRVPPVGEEWPFWAPAPTLESCYAECRFGWYKRLQKENGVGFDMQAAVKLTGHLSQRREELVGELREKYFQPWNVPVRTFTPAVNNKLRGYVKGCSVTTFKTVHFNPGSRAHIADRMQKLYGWKPPEFTETGLPKVDEKTLANVDHPASKMLQEYLTVIKRLGQISEGDKALIRSVKKDGLLHGNVHPSGTRTSRCSHTDPNMNIPKVKKHPETGEILYGLAGGYGQECRAMFHPTRPGWVQVGADAEKLELCMLAHRLAFFDDGAFTKLLLEGDPHSEWQRATGLYFRDKQKTLTYADLYGAGDEKRGNIILDDWRLAYKTGVTKAPPPPQSSARELGKRAAAALAAKVPGLAKLKSACSEAFKRGWVRGLDGRIIPTKTEHGTLNDVLQGDGAVVMKHAHVLLMSMLREQGWEWGKDFACMLDVHDEWQFECPPENADMLGAIACTAIKMAGVSLGVRCPLSGEAKVGRNWSETH